MRQVLQSAMILLQNATEQNVMFIKNCVHLTLAICNLVILSKSKSKRSDTDFKIVI